MLQQLRQGKSVPYFAILAIEQLKEDSNSSIFEIDSAQPYIVKLIELSMLYCISLGEISPTSLDLGRLGYTDSWKTSTFSFE